MEKGGHVNPLLKLIGRFKQEAILTKVDTEVRAIGAQGHSSSLPFVYVFMVCSQ